MRSFIVWASLLSSIVSAQQVITITEWRKCSTSFGFTPPSSTPPAYNSTQAPSLAASLSSSSIASSFSSTASARATGSVPNLGAVAGGVGALSPGAQKNVDDLFWLNYGRAIMKAAQFTPSENNPFFIGGATQKGPPAGSNIPEEYTNLGLHEIANGLLNDSSPFYTPSAQYGYAEALRDYLDYVDLEGNPTPAQEEALLETQQDLQAAHTRSRSEQAIAFQDFSDDETMGLTRGMTFQQWLDNNKAPAYTAALLREQQLGSQLESIQSAIAGPKAAPRARDRTAINKGFSDDPYPGYNMDAAVGKLSSPRELLNCFNNKVPCPTPKAFKVPLYSADRYKAFVQEAQAGVKIGATYDPADGTSFQIDTAESTSDFQFGQTSVSATVSPGGWFSFWSASAGQETTSSTLRTGSAASSVSIKITYDKIEIIPVTPGSWQFNPKQYKLLDSAPSSLGQLYRPAQLVVVSRLGYEIKVNNALGKSIDTQFKQTTSGGGGFRIFGIRIGASYSKTDVRNTHEASFDAATNTVKVVPKDDTGVATLIGVIGEKFDVLGG